MRHIHTLLCALLLFIVSPALSQVNLNSGLVAYYPLNGTFADASGNGNNGTGMNGVTFGADQWGNANNAAFFDGNNDWVDIGVPSFTFGHTFSVAFRFRTNTSRHQVMMSRSDYNGWPNNFNFQVAFNHPVHTPKGIYLCTDHSGSCSYPPFWDPDHFGITQDTITINQWYCAVMTFNNGIKKIFLNGVLKHQSTVSGFTNSTSTDSCTSGRLRLGSWWSGDPRYFSGNMDEIRLWNRNLNQQEIDSLCNLKVLPPSIINSYAAITDKPVACDNVITVDDASGFKIGDTVLMIQMKGATIDSSNTASFGTVTSYNGAGNYEQNLIKNISGNTITLLYQIKRNYDVPKGLVQLVRIPYFSNYNVAQTLTCLPWNGTKGGVFAINVRNALTLNESIDVSGTGFRGGQSYLPYNGKTVCNVPNFFQGPNGGDSSSQKGEGIASVSANKLYARGSLANGGGGGNAHNAGGGGGSNAGVGGIGGNNFAGCPNSSLGNITGGLGGISLTINTASNKLFLGGGGGAGHSNDMSNAHGGAGGGIIIINAGSIIGGNGKLFADGASGVMCTSTAGTYPCTDGMGGGGAGGTVAINAGSLSGTIPVFIKGGNGANVTGVAAFPSLILGPGGGGGGGALWVSTPTMPSAISLNSNGGANGVNVNQSNNSRGAQPGNLGSSVTSYKYAIPTDTFKPATINVSFTYKMVSCNTVQFSAIGTKLVSYLWNFGNGGTSAVPNPISLFAGPGNYNVTLTVSDSNGCTGTVTAPVTITNYNGTKKDTSICFGNSITLSVYNGAISYTWSPPTGLSTTNTYSTIASPASTTTYVVTVNNGAGCIFRDTFLVNVSPATVANFFYTPTFPIPNTPIKFNSSGSSASSYKWSFGDGTYSIEPNPSHLYKKTGTYKVCLEVSNGKCLDSLCKTVEADVRTAIAVPSAFSPNGDGSNDILYVRGGAIETMNLKIFNRWGQMVFETSEMSKGWDGTFKGKPQDIDIFAYIIKATFINGTTTEETGNISLLR